MFVGKVVCCVTEVAQSVDKILCTAHTVLKKETDAIAQNDILRQHEYRNAGITRVGEL